MSSLYQLIFKKINNYIINIANADTDAAGEAVRWNGVNPYAHPKEPENMQQWKQKNRAYIDNILKGSSIEAAAAYGYGASFNLTYAGNGKINVGGAIITGGSSLSVSAYKSLDVQGEKKDGIYTEACASAGFKARGGACFGSNGGQNGSYISIKVGTGLGWNFSSATGYSSTFGITKEANKDNKKQ